jgi:RHS repeat-associated protein
VQLSTNFAANGNIITKSNVSSDPYLYNGAPPHAVTGITNPINMPASFTQTISYTPYQRVSSIVQGTDELIFTYGTDGHRVKTVTKQNNITTEEIYFVGSYEKIVTSTNKEINYIYSPNGLLGIMIKQGTTETFYYTYTDYLGNIIALVDQNGNITEEYNFDAWGQRRNAQNWSYTNVSNPTLLQRGFTGHEHLDRFGLINMNARLYDPLLGRMLSPDNYVQSPDNIQSFNRYSYAWNNPLKYTDPDGEFVVAAVVIGAVIGAYMGGTLANGTYNPAQWDYSSGRTWGYMAGGAIVGAASGYIGGAVAASGMPMAKTAGIASGSFVNSVGTAMYTGGQTDVSVSFGVASYNFDKNEWRYLGKKGNSALENVGYGLGALANLSDLGKVGDMLYNVEKKDLINHAAIKEANGNTVVSYGPGDSPKYDYLMDGKTGAVASGKHYGKMFGGIRGTNDYPIHGRDIPLNGVNTTMIKGYGKMLSYLSNKGLALYSFAYSSCSTHAGLAMWLSGVPNLFIHPYTLQASVWLWHQGITPALIQNSYHLSITK